MTLCFGRAFLHLGKGSIENVVVWAGDFCYNERENIIVKLCTRQPENAPVSVKSGVVLHPLSDYEKTTIEGCDLLRFAPFCKKCDKIRGDKSEKYKSAKRAKTRRLRAFPERKKL